MIRYKILLKDGNKARSVALSNYKDIADKLLEFLESDYPDADFELLDEMPDAKFSKTMERSNELGLHN